MTRCILPVLLTSTLAYAQPPRPIDVAPIVPVEWKLLSQTAVRDDLGLSNEQKKALERVEAQQSIPDAALFWATRGALTLDLAKTFKQQPRDEYLTKTLTRAQRTRLRQIEYQLKEREFGAHLALAMAAKELGMRADQLEDVTSIKGQRVEEIAKLVTSGERFDKVKPKVESANTDTYEKIAEMLTKTQRERLKELKGKAFGGKVRFESILSVIDAGSSPSVRMIMLYPTQSSGCYDFELRYLADSWIHWFRLDCTSEQRKAIEKAVAAWETEYKKLDGKPIERATSLHKQSEKILDEILTSNQRLKFDELMIKRRMQMGGWAAACGYPSVVAKFKLSPIQLSALKEGRPYDEVLTSAEADALKKQVTTNFDIMGRDIDDPVRVDFEKVKADLEGIERQIKRTASFARLFLVISDRLKLSDEQIKKLRELAEDEPKFFELIQRELGLADTAPVAGAGRGITPTGVVSEQFREAMEEQCWNVLDDKQKSTAKAIYGRRK